jgi:hypothetical protein
MRDPFEIQVKLEVSLFPETLGEELPWSCVKVPNTCSVKPIVAYDRKTALSLKLEVSGATTYSMHILHAPPCCHLI